MMRGQTKECGARTRKGTYCRTIPMSNGRCRMHGGKSTGPKDIEKLKGNKNAVGNKARLTTGEFEKINWNTLKDIEKEWCKQPYCLGPYAVREEIDMLTPLETERIRGIRMIVRLNALDCEPENNDDDFLKLMAARTRGVIEF